MNCDFLLFSNPEIVLNLIPYKREFILSFSSTPSFRLSTAPERYSSMEVLFVFRIRVTKFLFGEVLNENVREDTRQKTRETAKFHSRTPLLHEFSASSRLLSSLQRS